MSAEIVAQRYAKSLIELAEEQNLLDQVNEEITSVAKALEVRDLLLLVKSPIVHASKKKAIFARLFGDMQPITKSFLNILVRKGRESYIPAITKSFKELYQMRKAISEVTLITAEPITEKMQLDIANKLREHNIVNQNINWRLEVDPALLGGFVVEVGDRRYDASIANKLQSLRDQFQIAN